MLNVRAWLIAGVSGLALLGACDSPSFVDVRVSNATEYAATVSVQDSPEGSILKLGFVGPRSARDFGSVIHQGDSWVFTFDFVGKHTESLVVQRAELERAEWEVEVPESFAEALRGMGQPPSP
jgi:hypothetical protein